MNKIHLKKRKGIWQVHYDKGCSEYKLPIANGKTVTQAMNALKHYRPELLSRPKDIDRMYCITCMTKWMGNPMQKSSKCSGEGCIVYRQQTEGQEDIFGNIYNVTEKDFKDTDYE